MRRPNLDDAARHFAEQLSGTIGAVVGYDVAFTATRLDVGDRLTVSTTDRMGIVLTADREPLLRLAVEFQCGWDAPGHFLAVHNSQVHVSSVEDRAPLLRYEFVKSPQSGIPCSHLHVHAHRDAFTHAMSRAGERTPRAKRRARGRAVGRVEDLHFPLGGARFRPALEDVLQMLVDEFGIDAADHWESHLAQGRQDWRHHQLAAAIRDNQKHAADTLAGLGYTVEPPLEGYPEGPGRQVSSY